MSSIPLFLRSFGIRIFWKSLDAASGKRWPIFAIRPKPGHSREKTTGGLPGGQGFLTSVPWWDEPAENAQLLKEFGLETTKKLPMLLVFAQLPSGDLIQIQCPFLAKSEEGAYKSLKDILDKIEGAIAKVTADNVKNTQEIFNLIQSEIGQYALIQKAEKAISLGQWIKSVFGLFS